MCLLTIKLIAILYKHVYNNTYKAKFQLDIAINFKQTSFKEKFVKFLHTADWHLGVKTNGRDRLAEQKKVLDEILSIVNYENVDCVIIAGDIFNSANPSADAEELFFDTIQKLSANGDRFVFVLAGNHDDPTRLTAGLPLASKHNIALVSNIDRLQENSFNKNGLVKVVETGRGHIKIQKNEEIVTIAYLPYPTEIRMTEKLDSDMSYSEKVETWAKISASAFTENTFNIFVSHLFVVGSKSASGVIKAGDFFAVEKNKLPKADYTALGHMHSPQCLGGKVYYSGAITQLSINQKDLGVNVFETEHGKMINFNEIKLQNVSVYQKVRATSMLDAEEKLAGFDDADIIELEIEQSAPLSASDVKSLKKNFTCISNIALIRPESEGTINEKKTRKGLNDSELFKQFYLSMRGFEPSDELVKMFLECKGEENETN